MELLLNVLDLTVFGLWILVFAGVVLSWLRMMSHRPPRWVYSPLAMRIDDWYSAIVRPFRNLMRRCGVNTGMIDISPILAIVAIYIAHSVLTNVIVSMARPSL